MKDNEFFYNDGDTHTIEIVSVDGQPAESVVFTKYPDKQGVEICVGEHYVDISVGVLQALVSWLEWSTTL